MFFCALLMVKKVDKTLFIHSEVVKNDPLIAKQIQRQLSIFEISNSQKFSNYNAHFALRNLF